MRTLFSICLFAVATTCFAQENADTAIHKKEPASLGGKTITGTVVHNRNQNCSTLIRIVDKERKDTVYFIPLGDAIKPYDRVGAVISFKYRRSMIKQPLGCTGSVVMLSDIKLISMPHKGRKMMKASSKQ